MKLILLRLGSRPDMRLWETPVGLVRSLDARRVYRSGLTGCADITGIVRGGTYLAIEAKVGDNVQRESQRAFAAMVERFGGVYVIAYSPEEAEEALLAALAARARTEEKRARHERLEDRPPVIP